MPDYIPCITVPDTYCNICGRELQAADLKTVTAVRERLSYWSCDEDAEHRVRWCADCFNKLLASCKLDTKVAGFTEINEEDYLNKSDDDTLPGAYCTVCGETLTFGDTADRLVIQVELDGVKHQIRFCQKCFEAVIKSCKRDSYIFYWGNHGHIIHPDAVVIFPPPEPSREDSDAYCIALAPIHIKELDGDRMNPLRSLIKRGVVKLMEPSKGAPHCSEVTREDFYSL